MSALDLLKKVKIQTLSFEKHPCRELDQEQMIHYLNGLALISKEDGNICEKEKEYLSILINSFGLSEDMLETFINFAENPDEKLILDMMQSFMTKDIKYNFMIDAMMIASVDRNFDDSEKAVIEQYFEMLKITKDEEKDLKYLYEIFYTQNGNALYRYFKRNEYMKVELFQYLLDYYQINMEYELKEDEKKILKFEFFKPTFNNGGLAEGAIEIMTKPVNNAQFRVFLNTAFMTNKIEIDGNGNIVDSETKDLLMDLDMSDIEFKDNEFIINSAVDEEKKITGITYTMANMFSKWVSEFNEEKYKLSAYEDYQIVDFSSFTNKPVKEMIYSNYMPFRPSYKRIGYVILQLSDNSNSVNFHNYRSSTIDKNFCSEECSFRMMKLPKKDKQPEQM